MQGWIKIFLFADWFCSTINEYTQTALGGKKNQKENT